MTPGARDIHHGSFLCTPTMPLEISGVRVIGERINPTGKKRFQQALLAGGSDYIVDVAIAQVDAGAQILDVNVGYPGVDEVAMLPRVVKKLQEAVDVPLQLDSTNAAALEAAFDFMEQAFAESQEMVVFVTELTVNPASHQFLTENGCERYFKYNKDLLLDHRKAALQQELAAEQRRHGGV